MLDVYVSDLLPDSTIARASNSLFKIFPQNCRKAVLLCTPEGDCCFENVGNNLQAYTDI
jgi:hypothetical protein